MSESLESKPRLCPDSECKCLFKTGVDSSQEKGFSFTCIGKLKEPVSYKYKEALHHNDLSECIFNPHGTRRFFVNIDDLKGDLRVIAHALQKIDKTFNWRKLESWATSITPFEIEKHRKLYLDCESKFVDSPNGTGLVKCQHTKQACQWNNCPVWIMKTIK